MNASTLSKAIRARTSISKAEWISCQEEQILDAINRRRIVEFSEPNTKNRIRFNPYELRRWRTGTPFVVGVDLTSHDDGWWTTVPLSRMWSLTVTTKFFCLRSDYNAGAYDPVSKLIFAVDASEGTHGWKRQQLPGELTFSDFA